MLAGRRTAAVGRSPCQEGASRMNAPLILKPSMSNHHPSDSISMDPILLYRAAPLILAVELEGLGLSELLGIWELN